MEKKCKNCANFRPKEKYCVKDHLPFGGCEMMQYSGDISKVDPEKHMVIYSDYEGYAAGASVNEEFGCIMFSDCRK